MSDPKIHKNIKWKFNGKTVKVTVLEYSRGGTKSDSLDIIEYNGRRITPFERRKRGGWSIDFQGALEMYLSIDLIKEELNQRNSLISLVKKEDTWEGATIMVPFKE